MAPGYVQPPSWTTTFFPSGPRPIGPLATTPDPPAVQLPAAVPVQPNSLARHEGRDLLSAHQAVLKGVLEAESRVAIISGPPGEPFGRLFDLAGEDEVASLLRRHGTRLVRAPEAGRSVTLALAAARSDRSAVALVPNDQLDQAMGVLGRARLRPAEGHGAMCVIFEDRPRECGACCPRRAAFRLGFPTLEPANVEQLRDALDSALRLGRAGGCPVGVVVHESILRSAEVLELRPNRVRETTEAAVPRPRRPAVASSDAGDVLRVARRLELNRAASLPSPGERLGVGFVVVGPARSAMSHLLAGLGLTGRVPVLQLGLLAPVDDSAVGRMLSRCEQLIVLEPRPGVVESCLLAVAEAMRRGGERPAAVWGQRIPPDPAGVEHTLEADEALHPSILARKIVHLLHLIRPTLRVASHLVPDPPAVSRRVPPRGQEIGSAGALALVRRIVADVDQWLSDRARLEERGLAPTTLAIDGVVPRDAAERIVAVETWDRRGFQKEGIAALRQAAADDRPRVFVVCETGSDDDQDLERLIRGVIPGERADRVRVELSNLSDRVGLRELIQDASLSDQLTVIIAADGPPARYDVAAIDRALAEIDHLGFQPKQRLLRPADQACEVRLPAAETPLRAGVEPQAPLRTQVIVDRLPQSLPAQFRFRVRPRLEQVEVVRSRPPVRSWRSDSLTRLPPPKPIHGRQPQWRVHLAGFRDDPPGLAARAISEAGLIMGYDVRSVHDPTPIGAGRRAWAQVLYTNPRPGEAPPPVALTMPYGQADLLLGLDSQETLRAIGPDVSLRVASADRTGVVVNIGRFGEESESEPARAAREQLAASLRAVSREGHRLIEDFAEACRVWFLTDRVVDLALLGAAFQLGHVPVSPDAIEAAVGRIESRGFDRAMEAFQFGRRLAVDRRLLGRPRDDRDESVHRIARRMVLSQAQGGPGAAVRARRFARIVEGTLRGMPGLTETDPGRQAIRDFVIAAYRCLIWGGVDYAESYANLIRRLYDADRGDTGRALTRNAILPLAGGMLIRDAIFVASMATSPEHRRRTRRQLNVRRARGDRIDWRYLTRLDLVVWRRRIRVDIRSSDWPARLAAAARHLVPSRWRGTRGEREVRAFLIDFAERAIRGSARDYKRFSEAMQRLHQEAVNHRLRLMALSEIKQLVEPTERSKQL